jgi:hypothetical protein
VDGNGTFDLLRARIESEVAPPAVIVITSSTAEDCQEIAARELAYSLSITGYATLYLDTRLASRGPSAPPQRLTLEEAGRKLAPDPGAGKLAVLNLGDMLMQKTTNQRHIRATLEVLRSKFDYVIVNTEHGGSTAFAATMVATSDAVLVTVKKGRREVPEDARLGADLDRVGSRFLGVVSLDPSVFKADAKVAPALDSIRDWRRPAHEDDEYRRHEIAEWSTQAMRGSRK